jgi:hypothetical protein
MIMRLVDGDGDQARCPPGGGPPAPRRGMPRRILSAESIARTPFSIQSLAAQMPESVIGQLPKRRYRWAAVSVPCMT